MIRFRSWAATHRGAVRDHNEDAYVDRPEIGLWAVADGAGGHQAGEVASGALRDALERIPQALSAQDMIVQVRRAIAATHANLLEIAASRGPDTLIASTIVVLLTHGDHYACLWAGDSRIYLYRNGDLFQLTRDHSEVQELVDAGVLRPEQAEKHPRANVITRAVGADGPALELEKLTDRVEPGDRFLLCSDGLFKALDAASVATLIGSTPDAAADGMIGAALRARATDNVTAVVVEALPDGGAADGGA